MNSPMNATSPKNETHCTQMLSSRLKKPMGIETTRIKQNPTETKKPLPSYMAPASSIKWKPKSGYSSNAADLPATNTNRLSMDSAHTLIDVTVRDCRVK